MKPGTVLLCFAVKEEAAFVPRSADGFPAQVLLTGMGAANATRSVRRHLEGHPAGLVLSCGFAGGLNPDLAPASVIFQATAPASSFLAARLSQAGARAATFHTTDRVITSSEAKARLWKTTGADAVEMESGPVLELCRDRGCPAAILRVISDTASEDLPLDFNRLMNSRRELSLGRLAWAVLRRPQSAGGLMRLHRRTRQAARRLAGVLEQALAGIRV